MMCGRSQLHNDTTHFSQIACSQSRGRAATRSSSRPVHCQFRMSWVAAVYLALVCLAHVVLVAESQEPQVVNAHFDVLESAPLSQCVFNISTTPGIPAGTTCTQPQGSHPFSIDNTRSCIQVASPLDYETATQNPRPFQAVCNTVGGPLILSGLATIIDVNDHAPVFNPPSINVTIPEGSRFQTLVAGLHAIDPDSGTLGQAGITFKLDPHSNIDNTFQIIGSTGSQQLVLRGTLDRESANKNYTLIVFAVDGGGRSGHLVVYVTVGDVNDNPPIFKQRSYQASEREDLSLHTPILTVLAEDADSMTNAIVQYSIQQVSPDANGSLLAVDPSSGVVQSVRHPLPRGRHTFNVFATDGTYRSNVTLVLTVEDVNDIAPTITRTCVHTLEYEEPGPVLGSTICQFMITDADLAQNGLVNVTLLNGQGAFAVDLANANLLSTPLTVPVKAVGRLDFENTTQYNLVLQVTDNGQPPQTSRGMLTVLVNDSNEFPPIFQQPGYPVSLNEDLPSNEPVERVIAHDPDGSNSVIMYSIVGPANLLVRSWFRIDSTMGVIYTAGSLDRELLPTFNLTVEARDTGMFGGRAVSLVALTTVEVNLLDANDNRPVFHSAVYTGSVAEGSAANTTVTRVLATDLDFGDNGTVEYSLLNANGSVNRDFTVSDMGVVAVAPGSHLDRETTSQYNLTCVASDKGAPPLSSTVQVIITVTDVNDHRPVLYPLSYQCNIVENMPAGQFCTTIQATDDDSGINSALYYSIASGNDMQLFTITNSTGNLETTAPLDAEKRQTYSLVVRVIDGGGLVSTTPAVVNISVINVRDQPPTFVDPEYSFSVLENATVSTIVGSVFAKSRDAGTSPGRIVYSITGGNSGNHFAINDSTGVITIASQLDREMISFYELVVLAEEVGSPPLYTHVTVNISVTDVNDNSPMFAKTVDNVNVAECHPVNNMSVYVANATDNDFNRAGRVRYSLLNTSDVGFAISRFTGGVTLTKPLDYETSPTVTLGIKAADRGQVRRTSTLTLIVHVQDCNDVAPVFSQSLYTASVNESTPPLSPVLSVKATDVDFGGNGSLAYSLQMRGSVPFGVSPRSGEIYVRQFLDRENVSLYRFTVVANDGNQSSTAVVEIMVTDTNDNAPVFSMPVYTFHVDEGSYASRKSVGSVVANDSDSGENARIQYTLVTINSLFSVDSNTGELSVLGDLDRENRSSYMLQVMASDQGSPPLGSTCRVDILVNDVNDNPPIFTQPRDGTRAIVSIDENAAVGMLVYTVKAKDADSGANAQINFFWAGPPSALFSLNDTSGAIATIAPLDYEANQQFNLSIKATDRGTRQLSSLSFAKVEVRIRDINDEPPVFVNTSGLTLSFVEDHPVNTELTTLVALDRESTTNGNGVVRYRILNQDPLILAMFAIDANTGRITLVKPFNFTSIRNYQLTIQATDTPGGIGQPLSTNYTLNIDVLQDLDTGPYFPVPTQTVDVPENTSVGADVLQINAIDRDPGANGILTYSILSQEPDGSSPSSGTSQPHFAINNATGWITLSAALDFEAVQKFHLVVQATDLSASRHSANATLTVQVININEHSPVFPPSQNFSLDENEGLNQPVYIASAQDQDSGIFGQVVYAFYLQDGSLALQDGPFAINATTGEIWLASHLDYESRRVYSLQIRGSDTLGHPSGRYSEVVLNISVLDVNDNAPEFPYAQYLVEIDENEPSGTFVVSVRATDRDSGDNSRITYMIPPAEGQGKFMVDSGTGEVRTTAPLDRDSGTDRYSFSVIATDAGNPALSSKVNVNVNVRDINDCYPDFIRPPSTYSVQENRPISTIDTLLVFDCDDGPNARVSYSIIAGNDGGEFDISPRGGLLVVQKPLDRERRSFYTLTIQVCDSPANKSDTLCSTAVANITVLDDNDNSPVFNQTRYSGSVPEDANVGRSVLRVHATDADGPTFGTIHYELTDPTGRFVIGRSSGIISVNMALNHEDLSVYSLTAYAVDNDPHGARRTYATVTIAILDVNDFTPSFTRTLYSVTVSTAIGVGDSVFNMTAFDIDSAENGRIAYAITTPSSLFSINPSTGLVTTTQKPTVAGSPYLLEVMATDAGSPARSGSANLSVSILPAAQSPPRFLDDLSVVLYQFGNVQASDRIAQVSATTDNTSVPITYSVGTITPSSFTGYFSIDAGQGILTSTRDITLSTSSRVQIQVLATTAPSQQTASTTVQLQRDLLQHTFLYFVSSSAAVISEEASKGALVITVEARSAFKQSVPHYSIIAGNDGQVFVIDPAAGTIRTNIALDFEQTQSYVLSVLAADSANFSRPAIASLRIDVQNTNDNPPVWHIESGPVTVTESAPPFSFVTVVQATDPDMFPLIYRIVNQPATLFNITQRGQIDLGSSRLDFEKQQMFLLNISCTDGIHTIWTTVTVHVSDANDNRPVFFPAELRKTVPENAGAGWDVATVSATDADSGANQEITYHLANDINGSLTINNVTGAIELLKTIPYRSDGVNTHYVSVVATDHGTQPLNATLLLIIDVADINDHGPVFSQSSYSFNVSEGEDVQSEIGAVQASDADSGQNSRLSYSIVNGDRYFYIDRNNGKIILLRKLNRETAALLTLNVSASDNGSPRMTVYALVTITVLDVNDNSPRFEQPVYNVGLFENYPIGQVFLTVSATDDDILSNADITYTLITDQSGLFDFGQRSGTISLFRPLSALTNNGIYSLTMEVEASDFVHTTKAVINLVIFARNQTDPRFTSEIYQAYVPENAPANFHVQQVSALQPVNPSSVHSLQYSFGGDAASRGAATLFGIDSASGNIFLKTAGVLDFETRQTYQFTVTATDTDNPNLIGSAQVVVNVLNTNEYSPTFGQRLYTFRPAADLQPGSVIGEVDASDSDRDSTVLFYFQRINNTVFGNDLLTIVPRTGAISVGSGWRDFTEAKLTVVVVATDGHFNSSANVTIEVEGRNSGSSGGSGSSTSTILIAVVIVVVVLLAVVVIMVLVIVRKRSKHSKSLHRIDSQYGYAPSGGAAAGRKDSTRALLTGSTSAVPGAENGLDSPSLVNAGAAEEISLQRMSNGTGSTYIHSDMSGARPHYPRFGMPGAYPMAGHEQLQEFGEEGAGEAWGGLGGGGAMDMNTMIFSRLAEIEADEHEAIMDGVRAFNADTLSHAGSIGSVARFVDEICSHSDSSPNLRQLAKELSALNAAGMAGKKPSPQIGPKSPAHAPASHEVTSNGELSAISPSWSSSQPSEQSDLIGNEAPVENTLNLSMSDLGAPEEITLSPQPSPSKAHWRTTGQDQDAQAKPQLTSERKAEQEERQNALDQMISFGDDDEDDHSVVTEDFIDEMRFSDYEAEEV